MAERGEEKGLRGATDAVTDNAPRAFSDVDVGQDRGQLREESESLIKQ